MIHPTTSRRKKKTDWRDVSVRRHENFLAEKIEKRETRNLTGQMRFQGKNRKALINERGRDMPPAITAIASPSLRKRYKDLLRSNWSSSSLESVLALLWDEIKGSADASGFAWWSMLQPLGNEATPRKSDPFVVERIRYFSEIIRDQYLPTIPKGYTGIGNPR